MDPARAARSSSTHEGAMVMPFPFRPTRCTGTDPGSRFLPRLPLGLNAVDVRASRRNSRQWEASSVRREALSTPLQAGAVRIRRAYWKDESHPGTGPCCVFDRCRVAFCQAFVASCQARRAETE